MAQIIDFPQRSVVFGLKESMTRHWRTGIRPPDFQHAVRREFPNCTFREFNFAADWAWHEVQR